MRLTVMFALAITINNTRQMCCHCWKFIRTLSHNLWWRVPVVFGCKMKATHVKIKFMKAKSTSRFLFQVIKGNKRCCCSTNNPNQPLGLKWEWKCCKLLLCHQERTCTSVHQPLSQCNGRFMLAKSGQHGDLERKGGRHNRGATKMGIRHAQGEAEPDGGGARFWPLCWI